MQRRRSAGEDADDEDVEEVEDAVVGLRERGLLGHRVFLALLTGRGGDSCCLYAPSEVRTMAPAAPVLAARGTRGGRDWKSRVARRRLTPFMVSGGELEPLD